MRFNGSNGQGVEIVHNQDYHWIEEAKKYLPRVTAVTGLYPKGEGFNRWLASRGSIENAEAERDAAAESGTKIHRAIQQLIEGKSLKYREFFPDEWKKLLGFAEWWKEYQPKPIAVEPLIWSEEFGMAGHPDLIADIGGQTAIVDYKAGNYLYPSHELQIEAYGRITEQNYEVKNAVRCLLHLSPRFKTGYGFKEFDKSDEKWEIVQALKKVFSYEHGDSPKVETVPETIKL